MLRRERRERKNFKKDDLLPIWYTSIFQQIVYGDTKLAAHVSVCRFGTDNRSPHGLTGVTEQMTKAKQLWDWSTCKETLVHVVQKTTKDCVRVDKIVCLALGHLRETRKASPHVQHLAACTIATTLEEIHSDIHEPQGAIPHKIKGKSMGKREGKPEPETKIRIPITAQDPTYAPTDIKALKQLTPKISVVDDPDGLLSIDERTLVITRFCNSAVQEVIADLVPKGPAAIFGNLWPRKNKRAWYPETDRNAPRVVEMYDGYERVPLWDELEAMSYCDSEDRDPEDSDL